MPALDLVRILNRQFQCACSHAVSQWKRTARPSLRQNSSIHPLQCARCGARVIAKMSGGRRLVATDCDHLHDEYVSIGELQPVFSGCARYGILDALGFFAVAGRGIMITRLFPGEALERYVRKLDAAELCETFQSAGVWLSKLHGAGNDERGRQGLEVGRRIDYLQATYRGAFAADRRVHAACELFASVGRDVDKIAWRNARIHGDFKPSNMLCNATRYVGLDIQKATTGAAVYDLAPFVNHLWLANLGGIGARSGLRHELAEAAFLAGFGDSTDLYALRWTQLYFLLCYWGGYQERGAIGAAIARWRILPLVEKIAAQLRSLT